MIDINKVTFEVNGLNFNKFLKALNKENIPIFNFERYNYKQFKVTILLKDKKTFLQLIQYHNLIANEVIDDKISISRFKKNLKRNLVSILCFVFLFLGVVYCSNLVLNIEVIGLENLTKQQVLTVLENNNIIKGNLKYSYDCDSIEKLLQNSINEISLVSVSFYGNSLVVNINEKIDNSNIIFDYEPIVANFDMIIKKINLISGTAVVGEGSLVKKGEILVQPYINYVDGSKLSVEARAEITAEIQIENTSVYKENHEELVFTGKTFLINQFTIFKKPFLTKDLITFNQGDRVLDNKDVRIPFSNFEVSIYEFFPFQNFLVPINKRTTIFRELVRKDVYIPFSRTIEENLIEENKKILYNIFIQCYRDFENIEYSSNLTNENNIYFITTYLKAEVNF